MTSIILYCSCIRILTSTLNEQRNDPTVICSKIYDQTIKCQIWDNNYNKFVLPTKFYWTIIITSLLIDCKVWILMWDIFFNHDVIICRSFEMWLFSHWFDEDFPCTGSIFAFTTEIDKWNSQNTNRSQSIFSFFFNGYDEIPDVCISQMSDPKSYFLFSEIKSSKSKICYLSFESIQLLKVDFV